MNSYATTPSSPALLPPAGEGRLQRGLTSLVASLLFFIAAPLFAQPTDAALEARVKALSAELRCLVCQNQTIADSDAAVARDMREQVRTQLKAGKSEAEVKTYMTERFGDFVLYKPAFKATTLLLWAGPFLVLALGLFGFVRHLRSNSAKVIPTELTDAERDRARALLNTDADAPRSAEPSNKS